MRVTLFYNGKTMIPPEAFDRVLRVLGDNGCEVFADESFADGIFSKYGFVKYRGSEHLFDSSDLIIVLGGDGSIIHCAKLSSVYGIPIVGINFGHLGYLAELETEEIDLLETVLSGNYRIEEHMMFDVVIERNGTLIEIKDPCLNETVLSNAPISRLAHFDLYCNGELVAHCDADGMIISTPTGSSAYSLSAGGPLIYPTMECILATPICPHSLTLRPVVFTGDSVIEIKNASCRMNKMYITVDGRDNVEVFTDDVIRISASRLKTKLVRVKDGGFINTLNRKFENNK